MENEWTFQIERLEAKLKEAELKALELGYKLGIAQEENKRFREALTIIMDSPWVRDRETAEKALKEPEHKTLRDEILDHKDAADQPDITITCRSEEDVEDAARMIQWNIPTKYKFLGHVFKDGTHTLTYRRA